MRGFGFRLIAWGLAICVVLPWHGARAGNMDIRVVTAISDDYILADQKPSGADDAASLRLVAAPNQYEPASFVVYANAPLESLRILATDLTGPDGAKIPGAQLGIRVVKRWYQRNVGSKNKSADLRLRYMTPELLLYDDGLVDVRGSENYLRMESGEYINTSEPAKLSKRIMPTPEQFPVRDAQVLQPLNIDAGDNRQFWVTVYIPPGANAGRYRADIEITAAGGASVVLPLELEVLPFQLAESMLDHSIYYRGILSDKWPDGSVSSEFKSEQQMLADLKNLHAHGIRNPSIYQKLATGKLPDVMRLRQEADIDTTRLLYLGVNISSDRAEENKAVLLRDIADAKKIAADFGVKDIYFYARDEAKDDELAEQVPIWDLVRAGDGKVMAAGWRSDGRRLGNFDITGGSEDLYVCNGMLNKSEADSWHSKGKLIYSYQNPTGGRHLPETWRRNYGLLLWQFNYDGGMPYAWQESYGNSWNDFDHDSLQDISFTYPTMGGPIDTVQWEGLREGIDDLRYLSTLLETLDSKEGRESPSAEEARQWVDALRSAPLGQQDLAALRSQMIGHILALQGYSPPVDAGLIITDLRSDALDADGNTMLRWKTSVRADSRVKTANKNAVESVVRNAALSLNHSVPLAGLIPDSLYLYDVSSQVPGADAPVSREFTISTDTGILVADSATSVVGDTFILDAKLNSNYRASVAVDWQNSLLGWWRFSSEANADADSSGQKSEANLKGDAALGEGWFGRGVSLDGDGAFINMPDVEIAENGTATLEGWFRFRTFAMDSQLRMDIFSGFYQHAQNNNLYFSATNDAFESASLLHLNTWHHIALTWDGDVASAVLYIDGQALIPKINGEVESIGEISGLNIGRSAGFLGGLVQRSAKSFNGDVDEIRVWNRVLSAAEIRASYDANQSRLQFAYPLESGAEAEWSLIGANAADQAQSR
jgi:hypothetical protein